MKEDGCLILSYVAFTCLHIWKAHCNFLFNQSSLNPTQLLMVIRTASGMFFAANGVPAPVVTNLSPPVGLEVRWSPPSFPFLKVNVDASCSLSSSIGYVRVVIREARGRCVATVRVTLKAPSVGTAEAFGVVSWMRLWCLGALL